MHLKTLLGATALALAASASMAADQTVDLSSGVASFVSTSPVLDGGDDVITFNNLAAGTYDFTLTMSGQYLTLSSADLNGVSGTVIDTGKWTFVGIDGTGAPGFVLTLAGTKDKSTALYSGELTVTAVPEPGTYALMFAGLAAVGFVARRRAAR